MTDDTIAAISTAPGAAGIAIVRLSGPDAFAIAEKLLSGGRGRPPSISGREPNTFFLATPRHPATRETLDRALALVFRAPRSYTGEDTVEFQCHGGNQTPARILGALLDAGARLANPGEFTQRAFLNGRMDLTQAEAVLDLLNARTERAAAAAQEQLAGRLGADFDALYETLLDLAATLEHHLDFNEDELPGLLQSTAQNLAVRLRETIARVRRLLDTFPQGRLLRDGAVVVIAGPPNAGKSSLLNALLGHDRAIVTPVPGTTRDTLEETFNLRGIPVRLVDTAGLRETDCPVEALGIGRARAALENADAVLYVLDATQTPTDESPAPLRELPPGRVMVLRNKMDLLDLPRLDLPQNEFFISALDPSTLPPVLDALHALLMDAAPSADASGACISARHRAILVEAFAACGEAEPLLRDPADWVVAAGLLRRAADAVATLTGRVYTDDLLDRVFQRFCVGK